MCGWWLGGACRHLSGVTWASKHGRGGGEVERLVAYRGVYQISRNNKFSESLVSHCGRRGIHMWKEKTRMNPIVLD